MKKILLVLIFIPLLFSTQCHHDDDGNCPDDYISLESLENLYGCEDTKYQMDIDLSDDYIVIQDQDTFDSLVTGSCLPEIDFSTYSLLIGKQGLTSGNTSITYSLSKNICISNQWELLVQFNQNATAEAPNLTYHTLIPNSINPDVISVHLVFN